MATSQRRWWFARRVDTCRARAARIDRAAAAWVAILTVACCVAVARAEADAACWRCAKWVKVPEVGFGFLREWEGLCAACQDPDRRCDEALKDLEARIEEYRDQLGYWKGILADAMRRKEAGEATFPGWPGFSMDEFITQVTANVASLEGALSDLRSRWADMKAECGGSAAPRGAEEGSSGASGSEGGGAGGGSSGGRGSAGGGGAPGTADTNAQELLDGLQKELERIRKLLEEQKESGSAPFYLVGFPSDAPAEAAYLDAALGGMKPFAAPSKDAPPASDRTAPAASQEDVIKPTLVDMEADLPGDPVAKGLELWQRHTANAAAYAEALLQSMEQVDAAKAAGNPERAHKHLERTAFLAAAGQKESRQAVAGRTAAIRTLYKRSKSFEEQAKGKGKTVEEALASWQATVRANGLPAEYVAELKAAGLPEGQIAQRREWLQSADPKEAAQAHARFVGLVAPLYLPEARGKEEGTPLPEADDVWDVATIRLLHTEHPVARPEAAKAGWGLLPILGAAAVLLLVVLVFVLRRRAAPLA